MKNAENIKSYTAEELKAMKAESKTNIRRAASMTERELEQIVAADKDEQGIRPDWAHAKLVFPKAKVAVNLRLEQETIDFFKAGGRGHIARMQAVLKAYVEAHASKHP